MSEGSKRILIIDDDTDNLRIVKKTLEHEGFFVAAGSSAEEGLELLSKEIPDLVLLDINMPGMSGLDLLRQLRQNEKYVAVIFLTAKSNTEDVIVGLDAGADDYVCKPFNPRELLARLRAQLRIKDLHDELRDANRRLQVLVDIDDLTGLYNMRSIYERLDQEIDRARRYKTSLAVVMMDMDNFKSVNDGHDHLFGSFVLSEVGQIIAQNVRTADFAARYGGDEFLMVLTHTSGEGARTFAERVREKISKHLFKQDADQIWLTASLGVAFAEGGEVSEDARGLVRLADNALYEAKRNGKNQVVTVQSSGVAVDPRFLRKSVSERKA